VYALVPAPAPTRSQWGTPTLTSNTLGAIAASIKPPEAPALRRALRAQWRSWNTQTFIMGPGPDEAFARHFVSWVIGRPPVRRQGVDVWYGLRRDLLAP
jgi:hypothetical protein